MGYQPVNGSGNSKVERSPHSPPILTSFYLFGRELLFRLGFFPNLASQPKLSDHTDFDCIVREVLWQETPHKPQ
jgi:hypothetical protein